MSDERTGFWGELRNAFVRGIGVMIPVAITFWVFSTLLNWMDGFLSPLFERWIGQPAPGLGFLGMIVLILAIGLLTKNLVGRVILSWFERLLRSIPIVRSVYGAIKDLFGALSLGAKSRTFRDVAMVEYPRPGLFCIGFVTNEMSFTPENGIVKQFTNVYIPNPPNPTSGFLALVPSQDVITLDLSIEEGLKLVLSGGIVVPEDLSERRKHKGQ
ncbi:MAG: DUF502 domain-containing protein [Ignavibacteria bacterium]|nr:DUF502 domain-containing protein [Ignavibacteria bacterium]